MKKTFKIANQDRAILFSGNAIRDYEALTPSANMVGDLAELVKAFETLKTLSGFSNMLYCGLKWGLYDPKTGIEPTPELTIPQITDWCDTKESNEIKPLILKHLLDSLSVRYGIDFQPKEEKKSISPSQTEQAEASGNSSTSSATS